LRDLHGRHLGDDLLTAATRRDRLVEVVDVLTGGLDQASGVVVRSRGVGMPGDDRFHAELLDLVHGLDPVHPLRVIGLVHPEVDAVVDDVAGKKRVEVGDVDGA
jgi:hypothetical protein